MKKNLLYVHYYLLSIKLRYIGYDLFMPLKTPQWEISVFPKALCLAFEIKQPLISFRSLQIISLSCHSD